MSSKSKKIIGGALALLFIVSIVQTQAILKITDHMSVASLSNLTPNDSQSAQVRSGNLTSLQANPRCLSISSIEDDFNYSQGANLNDVINDMSYSFNTDAIREFFIFFDVKNTCNYDIAIVDDSGVPFPNGTPTLSPAILENSVTREQALDIVIQDDSLMNITYGNYAPDLDVQISGVPMQSMDIYGNDWDFIKAWTIPAGQSEQFVVRSIISKYDENLPYTINSTGRLALKQLRWFRASSASDNILTASEVKTAYLSEDTQKLLNTSFIQFRNTDLSDIGGSNMTQQDFNSSVIEQAAKSLKGFQEEINMETKKEYNSNSR